LLHKHNNITIWQRVVQLLVLFTILFSLIVVLYSQYNTAVQKTVDALNEKIISNQFEKFAHLSKIFLKNTDNSFINTITSNKKVCINFENMLRIVRISTVENLFVVTKNSSKKYYFLLDSEDNPKKHADMFEPFAPIGNLWNKCYRFKKPQIFRHTNNQNLWITIAYPIVQDNKTVAIIGADISHNLDVSMKQKLQNFASFFFWILFFTILWFSALYISTLYFRRKFYDGYIDPLTSVNNRSYLYDIVIKKLARSYQLFMIDIDLFKKVNDTYGHDAGDYILQEVARRMSDLMRDEDALIRYGGEEFLVYTTDLDEKRSIEFANRIRLSISKEPIIYKDIVCDITISIGVNAYASNTEPFEDMLKYSDEALYMAKESGRNCVKVAKI